MVKKGLSIEIDVFADLQGQEIKSFNLFYKNSNQMGYFKEDLITEDGVYYSSKIPSDFINDSDIYYYIYLETESDIFTLPILEPDLNPFRVNVLEEKRDISNEITFSNSISHVNIIAPQHKEKILSDNLVVSVSYYGHDTIDINSIIVSLDGSDVTSVTNIKNNYLIFTPSFSLAPGEHEIVLLFADDTGTYFQPIVWSFTIIEKDEKESFTYSGKVWSDYTDNIIDGYSSSYNTSSVHFSGKTEWMKFNFKGRQSSLENPLEQSKNRYSFRMKNNFVDIHYGDFYPQFDPITLNGNRVRGVGFNLHTKFFQINMIKGELNRAIQGSIDDALDLSYSEEYDEFQGDYNQLTLFRNDYTFQNELTALRLSIGNKEKFNWGLNLVKVKDNIGSVNTMVDGAIINLDAITELFDSDYYVDFNDNDIYDGDDILYEDINILGTDDTFDYMTVIQELEEFIVHETSTIIVGTCFPTTPDFTVECASCGTEGCPIKQKIQNIEILYDDLVTVLDEVPEFNDLDIDEDNINYLEEDWSDTPKDNFVIGTDMKINSNTIKVNASIALSALNNNIWDPITTKYELDTILPEDDFQDCYLGRTYHNDFPDDYYWGDCNAYDAEGVLIVLDVNEPGANLNDLPNPQDLEDLIHYNPSQMTPVIPSLLNEEYGKSFSDILNYPEVAYDFNVRMVYPKQNIHFGIKKVGAEFNSLGNSYLQSDTKEEYISDRIKLLNNRMFLLLSWKSTSNGLTDASSKSQSDKYDINISYYPKINLPSFTINYGIYNKNNGIFDIITDDYENVCDDMNFNNQSTCEDGDGEWIENPNFGVPIDTTDTRAITETDNLNIYMNYNFNLLKINHTLGLSVYSSDTKDLLFEERLSVDPTYISPSSISNNYNLSLKSFINDSFNTDFYFSNSSYTYSKEESSAYTEQDILSTRLGMNYNNNKLVDKLGAWIDYSKGDGSSSYSQYGLKFLINLKLYKNLFMDINLRYYNRKIMDEDDYQNSIIKANISYNF